MLGMKETNTIYLVQLYLISSKAILGMKYNFTCYEWQLPLICRIRVLNRNTFCKFGLLLM